MMFKNPRNLLWQVPLAALLTMPFWKPHLADFLSPARNREDIRPPSLAATSDLTISEMHNVHFEQARKGKKEWVISANRLYGTPGDADLGLVDVAASFFSGPNNKRSMDIRSKEARYHAAVQELNLRGDVIIQNMKGYTMQAESLVYLENEKKIKTESDVRITGANISVSGKSFEYDIASGDYRLNGNVICKVW